MLKSKKILFGLIFIFTLTMFGCGELFRALGVSDHFMQRCGTDSYETSLINKNSSILRVRDSLARNYSVGTNNGFRELNDDIVSIPVVVHIVGQSAVSKINMQDVLDQINILNDDYRKRAGGNGFGDGVDTRIEFCLAKIDPNGMPSSGVTNNSISLSPIDRNASDQNSNSDYRLKQLIQWNPHKYLNIYVAEICCNVLGYATFPWVYITKPHLDGVVLDPDNFGFNAVGTNFNMGRTATHEVGHWLGLYHTFQKGMFSNEAVCYNDDCSYNGDQVCDTPPIATANFGCPIGINSCQTIVDKDMIENYMDYTNDACMNAFTQGQADRMRYYLTTNRRSVTESDICPKVADPVVVNTGTNGEEEVFNESTDCQGGGCKRVILTKFVVYGKKDTGLLNGRDDVSFIASRHRYNNCNCNFYSYVKKKFIKLKKREIGKWHTVNIPVVSNAFFCEGDELSFVLYEEDSCTCQREFSMGCNKYLYFSSRTHSYGGIDIKYSDFNGQTSKEFSLSEGRIVLELRD